MIGASWPDPVHEYMHQTSSSFIIEKGMRKAFWKEEEKGQFAGYQAKTELREENAKKDLGKVKGPR